jgi:hypothetical protein
MSERLGRLAAQTIGLFRKNNRSAREQGVGAMGNSLPQPARRVI